MLGKVLLPLQSWLDRIARRLEMEANTAHRAAPNVTNGHALTRPSLEAEVSAFQKEQPIWVDRTETVKNPPARKAPAQEGWPDLNPHVAPGETHPLKKAYKTFKKGTIEPTTVPPGETLYRIVDPRSSDNSICWMQKAEFEKLRNKDD